MTAHQKNEQGTSPRTVPLLLEVGCEEIPARFLEDSAVHLGEHLRKALLSNRLSLGPDGRPLYALADAPLVPLRTFFTPRRLVAFIPSVLASQFDIDHHIEGPPVRVALGPDGRYTRAAEAFVARNDAKLDDVRIKKTAKGDYLELVKIDRGSPALGVLARILPSLLSSLSFPKSMYWTARSDPRFVRPIRWVLAMLGEGKHAETVNFEILGVKSGNFTYGHRAKSYRPLRVTGFKDYMRKLERLHVEIDPAGRRQQIVSGLLRIEMGSFRLVPNEWLMDWAVNSTEWPRPMLGNFDERFLHLPREILITVMRDHQKYFAVEDEQGNLRPHFVTVLNMDSDEKGLIRQGHERVLAARFRDAEYFWNADQRLTLRDRIKKGMLDNVIYHAKLGTYGEKIERMRRMQLISDEVASPQVLSPARTGHLRTAIELSKCDLTTQMVQEFPELQGIVGGLYAEAQGEAKEVSDAIKEHYLPQGFEGPSPKTPIGALLSFIDKFDAVLAGFAAELEPKGSNDPFAMRRQAAGIVKVLLEFPLPIDLQQLITASYARLNLGTKRPGNEVYQPLLGFFGDRLRHYLENLRGFRYDTVRAVLAAGFDVPADALARAEAMEALRGGEDFEALSVAAKRIRNILTKSATAADWQPGQVEAALLKEPQERELYDVFAKVAAEAGRRREGSDYRGALEEISTLRPAVDRFFDKVLVMAEDRAIRQNRLRLLKKLDELFSGIAHFAEIGGG